MADYLTKAKKQWSDYRGKAMDVHLEYRNLVADGLHHNKLVKAACGEISRRIAELKKGGAVGSKLTDFDRDKDVQAAIKVVMNANAQCATLDGKMSKLIANAGKLNTDMEKFKVELDKEVADRKKKKDRKVLATDSKSLPEIEKMSKDVKTAYMEIRDNVINQWSSDYTGSTYYKQQMDEAVRSTDSIKAQDKKGMTEQSLDMRVFNRRYLQATNAAKAVVAACGRGEAAVKANDAATAREEAKAANGHIKEMLPHVEHYQEYYKSLKSEEVREMEADKNGKIIIRGIRAIMKDAVGARTAMKDLLAKLAGMKAAAPPKVPA